MTYKRIIQIDNAGVADAMADEAKSFGVTFRPALNGGSNEYVIEGTAKQRSDIEAIISTLAEMDREAAQWRMEG